MITIKETTAKELDNVKALWADGDVMKFVGFPEGLLQTDDEMKAWLDWIESQRPQVNHYSIFDGSVYCGETFYSIDSKHGNSASMDIKLFGFARGKGIAAKALSYWWHRVCTAEAFKADLGALFQRLTGQFLDDSNDFAL